MQFKNNCYIMYVLSVTAFLRLQSTVDVSSLSDPPTQFTPAGCRITVWTSIKLLHFHDITLILNAQRFL